MFGIIFNIEVLWLITYIDRKINKKININMLINVVRYQTRIIQLSHVKIFFINGT